jgi:hypothetical protein
MKIIDPVRKVYSKESLNEMVANCKKYPNYRVLVVFPNYKELTVAFITFPTEDYLPFKVHVDDRNQEVELSRENGSWIRLTTSRDGFLGCRVNALLASELTDKSILDTVYVSMLYPYHIK